MAQRYSLFDMYSPVQDREKRREMTNRFLSSPEGQDWTRSNTRVGTGLYESPVNVEATIPQEAIQSRTSIDDYMRIQSAINRYESKQDAMPNLIRKMVGRSGSLPSTGASSSADLKYIMGQTDEGIQNEILKRQRAAILRDEISNIDEQMAWYQRSGFDPHFAKTAREAAQSIFAQRRAQTGEERADRSEARAEDAAARADENLVIAQQRAKRDRVEANLKKTKDRRDKAIKSDENALLKWAANEYYRRVEAGEPANEATRAAVERDMLEHSRDPEFIGFTKTAGGWIRTERGQTETPPVPLDRNEDSLIDQFRKEIKIPADADEDEDFVTVPAREYFETYKEDWDVAADDFDTARRYKEEIDAAIAADPNIAKKDKQAVYEKVISNLESVEKGVGRPTEPTDPAMLRNQKTFEGMLQVAPFPVGGELSTPENIREAQNNFTRTMQIMERVGRASNEYLAQLLDPQFKDRMYREATAMKAMHPDSRSIAMNNNSEPNLVAMRNAVGAINERLSAGKYKNDEGKTVKLTDADRMNLEEAKLAQFQKYADHWGTDTDYSLFRYDPIAYRNRKVNF